MEAYKQEFIEFMVDCDVLKFGDFTLKSGRKSPFFKAFFKPDYPFSVRFFKAVLFYGVGWYKIYMTHYAF